MHGYYENMEELERLKLFPRQRAARFLFAFKSIRKSIQKHELGDFLQTADDAI